MNLRSSVKLGREFILYTSFAPKITQVIANFLATLIKSNNKRKKKLQYVANLSQKLVVNESAFISEISGRINSLYFFIPTDYTGLY